MSREAGDPGGSREAGEVLFVDVSARVNTLYLMRAAGFDARTYGGLNLVSLLNGPAPERAVHIDLGIVVVVRAGYLPPRERVWMGIRAAVSAPQGVDDSDAGAKPSVDSAKWLDATMRGARQALAPHWSLTRAGLQFTAVGATFPQLDVCRIRPGGADVALDQWVACPNPQPVIDALLQQHETGAFQALLRRTLTPSETEEVRVPGQRESAPSAGDAGRLSLRVTALGAATRGAAVMALLDEFSGRGVLMNSGSARRPAVQLVAERLEGPSYLASDWAPLAPASPVARSITPAVDDPVVDATLAGALLPLPLVDVAHLGERLR